LASLATEDAFVDVAGQKLWTSIRGRGESDVPLLLIMGFGGNLTLWDRFRTALGAHETIAFDLPGAGLSARPRLPSRARGIAKMIVSLLDALGYGEVEVDVLGVSLGGGLAQELVHRAPQRVRRLILCSTSTDSVAIPGSPSALLKLVVPPIFGAPHVSTTTWPTTTTNAETRRARISPSPGAVRRCAATRRSFTAWLAGRVCRGCTPLGRRRSCWRGRAIA